MIASSEHETLMRLETFRANLLAWFRKNRRSFLWRETTDPWLILISELLLKKTQADRVNAFIPTFLKKYSNPEILASTPQDELERDLSTLGLQKQRAAHLKDLGHVLVEDFAGEIPQSEEELRKLPGLGDYGCNAVLCFAFGKRVPIIDANVVRVLLRVFPTEYSRAEARRSPEVWELAWTLLPENNVETKDYNLALLDLGATVCLPRNPKCNVCPVLEVCSTGKEFMNQLLQKSS